MTNKNITLQIWKNNSETALATQGEVNSRFLTVKIEDENGPIDLTGKKVYFFAKKPDDNIIFVEMTVEDAENGTAVLSLTSQMSAVSGFLSGCEIHVMSASGNTLIVKEINILVQPSLGICIEESLSELSAFQQMVSDVTEAKQHVLNENNPHNVTAAQIGVPSKLTDLTGTLPVNQGGTGATTASTALTALGGVPTSRTVNSKALSSNITLTASDVGAAEASHNHSANNITSGVLSIAQGGTGAITVDEALTNLKVYTSVESLGLTSPCTTVDIIKAMPTNSEVKISVNKRGNSITDLPVDYCLLTVRYNALNRYQILCTNMSAIGSEGTYIGNYVRNTSISWEKMLTDKCTISSLQTSNKTIIGAINELYNLISNNS